MGAPEAPLGGSWEEPRQDGGGGLEGNDGGQNPGGAGRARASGSGCGGASGASAAEGGWLSGTVTSRCRGGRTPPHCLPHRGPRPASGQRPPPRDRLPARPSSGGSADPRPLGPQLGPALPASPARSSAPRCPPRRPAPGWGRGSATESGDGPPSGHRAAPGGLTDRENRPRWVWAGLTALWGRPGNAGAGGRGENSAVVSCGEPRRAATRPPPPPAVCSGQSLTRHSSCHLQEPRLDVKRMPQCPPSGLGGDMASLMPLSPYLSPTVLLQVSCDLGFVRADRPPSPVNVTVTHLRANWATVSWDVPEGNIVIGYSISQQRQNGPGQRVIREVNTTTRACALWGLAEDSDYTVQVRSISLRGESPPGPRVHFRTLKGSDRLPSNSSGPGDSTVEGLDGERPLPTGEVVITVVVLLMWAAVIGLFCRQYDIIKDNDSTTIPRRRERGQNRVLREGQWGQDRKSPSINTIDV
ncbi:uncharacterized protein LOC101046395 [Saimiri boliviensis]|uniref:uncharacterized protein LOC101046395 n=1 Tax=Saimiri boliviensis TaxID=27679 RepID=UPI003D77FF34